MKAKKEIEVSSDATATQEQAIAKPAKPDRIKCGGEWIDTASLKASLARVSAEFGKVRPLVIERWDTYCRRMQSEGTPVRNSKRDKSANKANQLPAKEFMAMVAAGIITQKQSDDYQAHLVLLDTLEKLGVKLS